MGLIGWIVYAIFGFILFIVLGIITNKYEVSKFEKMIISLILMMFVSGLFVRFGIPYTQDIFLIFIFLMIVDILYHSYFLNSDFFDKNEGNIKYYIILIILGLIVNYEFINNVYEVFLTGEDLRIVLWFLSIIFIYKFINDKKILSRSFSKNKFMSQESVLVSYAKLKYKYYDDCNYENNDLCKVLYSIMICQNSKRSKLLRKYDNLMFRINGNPRKLGIMQVESKKFISDTESIDIVYKKLVKLFDKKSSKNKNAIEDVIVSYCKDDYLYVKYIFDIIKKI